MDDDYDYQQTRRDHRKQVGIGIAVALVSIALLVVRFAIRRERDYGPQPVYVPPPVTAPPLAVAREPIEFQLAVGSDTFDVIPDQPLDIKGTKVTLEQNPTWQTAGDGYHFRHRSSVSVSPTADMVIASTDGTVVKLQKMDAKIADKKLEDELSFTLTGTGQTRGTPTPITRKIAGADRTGVRHDTTTQMQVEVYVAHVGKLKLGVLVYRQDPTAPLDKIDALLDSIAEGPGEPLPEFTAKVGATPTQLFIDEPAELPLTPPAQVTLVRRPTVLRTMAGNGGSLTFEHPRGMTVSRMPNDQMLAVTIQTDRAAIQLFDLGMHFTVEELKNALLGQLAATDLGEVTHSANGQTVRGRHLRLAQLPVEHELYVFDRNGKTIGASIQYAATDEKLAIDAAMPILTSVK